MTEGGNRGKGREILEGKEETRKRKRETSLKKKKEDSGRKDR